MTAGARSAFQQAASFFVGTVSSVQPDQWDRPALGSWSVRDLTGHASRALLTVETYLGHSATAVEVDTSADYFLKALASIGEPTQVMQRGRQAGAALGDDPARAVRDTAERVLDLVSRAGEAEIVATPVGGMRLGDYLPTRTFELVVHTLDLASAIDAPVQPSSEATAVSLELAITLALRSGSGPDVLLALTGRRPLPANFSVI